MPRSIHPRSPWRLFLPHMTLNEAAQDLANLTGGIGQRLFLCGRNGDRHMKRGLDEDRLRHVFAELGEESEAARVAGASTWYIRHVDIFRRRAADTTAIAPSRKRATRGKKPRKPKFGNPPVNATPGLHLRDVGSNTPLKIPYGNKEVAQKLGARYGTDGWYAPPGVDLSAFTEKGWL